MKRLGFAGVLMVGFAATASAQQQGQKPLPRDVPAEQLPPKGMCRIWLKDVPAAQQPAPTDCSTAIKNCPANGIVVFGPTEEVKNKPKADTKTPVDTKKTTPVTPIVPRKPPAAGFAATTSIEFPPGSTTPC